MKKLYFIALMVGIMLMGTYSCTEIADDRVGPENAALLEDEWDFYELFIRHLDKYPQKAVPTNTQEENLFQAVFSAAAARWYETPRYGVSDVYTAVFQSWGTYQQNITTTRGAMDAIPDIAEMARVLAEYEGAPLADFLPDAVVRNGAYFYDVINTIYSQYPALFPTLDDATKLILINLQLQNLGLSAIEPFVQAPADMAAMKPQIQAALAHRDYNTNFFTFRDGCAYIYGQDPSAERTLTVLSRLLEVVVIQGTEANRQDFVKGIATLINNNEWIFSDGHATRDQMERMLLALSTAASAVEFWKPVLAPDFPRLTVYRPSISTMSTKESQYALSVDANVAWTAVPSASWIKLDRTNSTQGNNIRVTLEEIPSVVGGIPRGRGGKIDFYMEGISVPMFTVNVNQAQYVTMYSDFWVSPDYILGPPRNSIMFAINIRAETANGSTRYPWVIENIPSWLDVTQTSGTGSTTIAIGFKDWNGEIFRSRNLRQADLIVRNTSGHFPSRTLSLDQFSLEMAWGVE